MSSRTLLILIFICHLISGSFMPDNLKKLKDDFDALPLEEQVRRTKESDDNYEKLFGVDALQIKRCILNSGDRGEDNLSPEVIWIDKRLEKEGLFHLDKENFIKWVYNAPQDSMPWLIMFGWTPYGNSNGAF